MKKNCTWMRTEKQKCFSFFIYVETFIILFRYF
nr:MAG TPA: hypothetical protein [Caudoviricetes sp.]DAP50716.1 MAG TPA: hypothetical protein [Caudoviricetes sp.]